MFERLDGPWKIVAAILLFPTLFQDAVLSFAFGVGDPFEIAMAKRFLLLLPALAVIFACWATIASLVTVVVRSRRRQFSQAIFVTWWDLGRAIFSFWGGIIKFCFLFLGWIGGLARVFAFGFLLLLKDILLLPVRLAGDVTSGYFKPGIPWVAIAMMTGWALLEALIFTFVMTPLVQDVLSGLTSQELSGWKLQVPLYLTFFIFVMGSYAVLHSFGLAVQAKNVLKIINYAIVEVIVAMVEVVFLYREFVDALVPWFAQHAGEGFELGIIGTLGIAAFAWLGIRAMTWFLFGASAIPMLMAMIQRTGLDTGGKGLMETLKNRATEGAGRNLFAFVADFWSKLKADMDWLQERGEDLLGAFILPPLQVIAACINFCTLLISSTHLFELPFKNIRDILEARVLLAHAKSAVVEDK